MTQARKARQRDPQEELLREILGSPDRDHCPGSLPIVSVHPDDEKEYLQSLARRRTESAVLRRRGVEHGEWVELDATEFLPDFRREIEPGLGPWTGRWYEAQPIVLRGAVPLDAPLEEEIQEAARLFDRLQEEEGLASWIEERSERLPEDYERSGRRLPESADPERDLERVLLRRRSGSSRRPGIEDLWLKSGWLSTHPDDRSLRLRVSFGAEGKHDASREQHKHEALADLAECFLPGLARIVGRELGPDQPIRALLDQLCGRETLFSQHIGYWNAPEGGALFHHDAFGHPEPSGQLGVTYLQLSGRTAWVALPISDLADRVMEFSEALIEGELPWVRTALFGKGTRFDAFRRKLEDPDAVLAELALPGQGTLGPLVNRGPEFTGFLADCGHAFLLRPGDAILLPNWGFRRTTMHSVFAAPLSDEDVEPGYALSLAVRSKYQPNPEDF